MKLEKTITQWQKYLDKRLETIKWEFENHPEYSISVTERAFVRALNKLEEQQTLLSACLEEDYAREYNKLVEAGKKN